jgi:hypothetical protein
MGWLEDKLVGAPQKQPYVKISDPFFDSKPADNVCGFELSTAGVAVARI